MYAIRSYYDCHPDGRDIMRKEGKLKFIEPDEAVSFHVGLEIIENSKNENQ